MTWGIYDLIEGDDIVSPKESIHRWAPVYVRENIL
jgi:hypothetical protein